MILFQLSITRPAADHLQYVSGASARPAAVGTFRLEQPVSCPRSCRLDDPAVRADPRQVHCRPVQPLPVHAPRLDGLGGRPAQVQPCRRTARLVGRDRDDDLGVRGEPTVSRPAGWRGDVHQVRQHLGDYCTQWLVGQRDRHAGKCVQLPWTIPSI